MAPVLARPGLHPPGMGAGASQRQDHDSQGGDNKFLHFHGSFLLVPQPKRGRKKYKFFIFLNNPSYA
jgi:hypothetical protein